MRAGWLRWYFENVGGPVFDAVCDLLNSNARISLRHDRPPGEDIAASRARWFKRPRRFVRGLEVHPLFVGDFVASHQAQFLEKMGDYVRSGRVSIRKIGQGHGSHAFRAYWRKQVANSLVQPGLIGSEQARIHVDLGLGSKGAPERPGLCS